MSSVRNQLNTMLDYMGEEDIRLLLNLVRRFYQDPDDILTPEDLEAHRQTMEEYARGELVDSEDIDWD